MSLKTVNISFPEKLLEEIDQFAKGESLSRSDVLRIGTKRYIENYRAWRGLQNYGLVKARKLGLKSEEEVVKRILE